MSSDYHSTDALEIVRAAGVPVRLARVNLSVLGVHVTVQVANGFPHRTEKFHSMIARSKPAIAVNGSYFCKRMLAPIGDIVIQGQLVHQGLMGTALTVTADNQVAIRRVPRHKTVDWSGYQTVLACGPALVLNGETVVDPMQEGFHDPHIMGACRRMGIGVSADGKLLIVNTLAGATFRKWAEIMRALDCTDAMNLDAGASLGFYYRERFLERPQRELTNVFLVHASPSTPFIQPSLAKLRPDRLKADVSKGPKVLLPICADTGLRGTEYCPEVAPRNFLQSRAPKRFCRKHHP